MKNKKILILILLILLTGCSNEYTLKISNNKFKEDIKIIIPKNIIPEPTPEVLDGQIELDDQITPFLEEKTESLISNEEFYKKKVIENADYFQVEMNYTYDEKSFKDANSLNSCFEYPDLDFSENYYINLQGAFYCLYGDSTDIKIETKNRVYFNNADEVSGNTYIWHIDDDNSDYVDIRIEVDKGISTYVLVSILLIIFFLITIGFAIFKFVKENRKSNAI